MRVIDACASRLYTALGVCVDFGGLVHRLLEYREADWGRTQHGWWTRCGVRFGPAARHIETLMPITCIHCASGR